MAPFFAMSFAQDVVLGPKDSDFWVDGDGVPSKSYLELWQRMGAAGEAALKELSTHPNEMVRVAATTTLGLL